MYTLLYAMYAAENGKASLNRFKEALNSECNTHSKRVAHMAMRNKVFQTIVDFMELYHTTMGPNQIQTDLGDARSAALKHITKLLDDGLVFSSEWYEPDLWIRLAKHPVIKLLEPVVVAYRGVRRSSSNLLLLFTGFMAQELRWPYCAKLGPLRTTSAKLSFDKKENRFLASGTPVYEKRGPKWCIASPGGPRRVQTYPGLGSTTRMPFSPDTGKPRTAIRGRANPHGSGSVETPLSKHLLSQSRVTFNYAYLLDRELPSLFEDTGRTLEGTESNERTQEYTLRYRIRREHVFDPATNAYLHAYDEDSSDEHGCIEKARLQADGAQRWHKAVAVSFCPEQYGRQRVSVASLRYLGVYPGPPLQLPLWHCVCCSHLSCHCSEKSNGRQEAPPAIEVNLRT
ncbi:hypothetical protein ISCGN_030212 [Ixodes scapularis]